MSENALVEAVPAGLPTLSFTRDQVELVKRTVAKGATDDELALFLYTAKATGLNPLLRQIHAVKRWDTTLQKEVMAVQVGIDGLRLVAERTGKYAPGREPSFSEKDGQIVSATAYVKKLVGGEWHEVSATAYFTEYAAKKKDGSLTLMWATKGHIMLSKCAEALALRRAFPNETSGVHTDDELAQAENPAKPQIAEPRRKSEAETEKNPDLPEGSMIFVPQAVASKDGETKGKKWTRFGVKANETTWLTTFDKNLAKLAEEAKEAGQEVEVKFEIKGEYKNIVDLVKVSQRD